jgi:DNA sulfur modification protein DndC
MPDPKLHLDQIHTAPANVALSVDDLTDAASRLPTGGRTEQRQLPLGGQYVAERQDMLTSIRLTLASLNTYLPRHDTVAVAMSGGKDSTTLLTVLVWAILTRRVVAPKRLVVLYADTRLELLPLQRVVDGVLDELEDRRAELEALGTELVIRRVMAPVDRRFFVQMLGRGVPPPHNKFRWCTPKLKVDPMAAALEEIRGAYGKPLLLHGVRIGESAVRNAAIANACGNKEDSECGQGWYQQTPMDAVADKLGPILHWRVCHVAAWLSYWAAEEEFGGWDTSLLVQAYGGEEAMEAGARTGCVGCPLVTEDRALGRVVKQPAWAYLAPLTRLRGLYEGLRSPTKRLRKPPGERRLDGELVSKQERLGPLTLEARRQALDEILSIQAEVNAAAGALRRPRVDLLNAEERARIEEYLAGQEWPDGWTGDEPVGETTLMPLFSRTIPEEPAP